VGWPVSGPATELVAVVSSSSVPAVLVQIPSAVIWAASEAAAGILGIDAADLVGHNFEEFTTDQPTGAIALLLEGRLKGFESERAFRGRDGSSHRVQMWVRVLEEGPPVEFVVGVLWPAGSWPKSHLPAPGPDEAHAIFGTVSPELLIERISEDVSILGLDAIDLVGAPMLRLVRVDSAVDALVALAEAATRAAGVCLTVLVDSTDGEASAELLIRRLVPSMSFAFSLVLGSEDVAGPLGAEEALRKLGRGLRALDTGDAAASLDRAQRIDAEKLSSRELEIIARLISGDRVPAIAQALFLSQSTIRNHLSSAFRKLGVASQQELVDLYRQAPPA
jgi:PAS domain S-box-containing protein